MMWSSRTQKIDNRKRFCDKDQVPLRYSHHASERMVEQGINRGMVETVVAAPDTVIRGDTADEYDAHVEPRQMRVVVAHRDPPLVITAYWIFSEEARDATSV